MSMKRVYRLDGLDCANCAAKIEKQVIDLSEVLDASINLLEQKLTVLMREEISLVDNGMALLQKISQIVTRIEPFVKVSEIINGTADEAEGNAADELPVLNEHHKNNMSGKEFKAGMKANSRNAKTEKAKTEKAKTEKTKTEKAKTGIKIWGSLIYDVKNDLIRVTLAIGLSVALYLIKVPEAVELAGYILAYILAGYEICFKAAKNLIKGQIFDENFLMTIASICAFAIGDRIEAVSILVFYDIGELLQDLAVNRSRRNIEELMDIRPDYANKLTGDIVSVVKPETIERDDLILVKPGERIPLDGVVVKGSGFVDTRALTGESIPTKMHVGDELLAGTVNQDGILTIRVSKPYTESTVSKILELVRNSASKKAQSEKFITKFARVYTPAVVIAAVSVALIPPLLGLGAFDIWLYRALSFLIISCPCALVISIPLSYFGGIGGGARHGILVKGSNYLDALQKVDTIVFDKTGTLTRGVFELTKLVPAAGTDAEKLLLYAAIAEKNSNHPIAKSIINYYTEQKRTEPEQADSVIEAAGQGIIASLGAELILAGNDKLMRSKGIDIPVVDEDGSIVHVAANGSYLGYIVISDVIKPAAAPAIEKLKKLGVRRTVMLTGDRTESARAIAVQCKLDEYRAQLLPQDKVVCFEEYKQQAAATNVNISKKGKVVFVGDGINDAPVLAGADIGIAMGGIGSDAAIEAADVVIMNDNPLKIASAIIIARRTKRIVIQNIVFALAVKLLIMIFALFGISSIWFAIFADVGVALLALLNAMRAMYINSEK